MHAGHKHGRRRPAAPVHLRARTQQLQASSDKHSLRQRPHVKACSRRLARLCLHYNAAGYGIRVANVHPPPSPPGPASHSISTPPPPPPLSYSESNALSEAATSSLPSSSSGGGVSLGTSTVSGAKGHGGGHADAVGRQSRTLLGALLTELVTRVVVKGSDSDAAAPIKTFQERMRLPKDVALIESFACEWLPGGFTVGFCRGVLHVCDGGLAFEPMAICPSAAAWSAVAQTIDSVSPSSYALVINSAVCVRMRDGSTREFAMFFGRAAAMSAMVCLRKYGVKVSPLSPLALPQISIPPPSSPAGCCR